MKLILWKIEHKFNHTPHIVDVTLSIEAEEIEKFQQGQITITIENDNIKNLSLIDLEKRAIECAKKMLA